MGRFLNEITADEFRLWQGYYMRHSLGEERADARQLALVAQLARLIGSMFGGDEEKETQATTTNLLPGYPYFSSEDTQAASVQRLWAMQLAVQRTPNFYTLPQDEKQKLVAQAQSDLAARAKIAGRRVSPMEILKEEKADSPALQ